MEHSRTRHRDDQIYDCNPGVQYPRHNGVQTCLAHGAGESEHDAKEVKLGVLATDERQYMPKFNDNGVEAHVCPTPDSVFRGVLPRLHAITMVEVMCGLPVVVDLIAVMYRGEECAKDMSGEEYIEGDYGFRP